MFTPIVPLLANFRAAEKVAVIVAVNDSEHSFLTTAERLTGPDQDVRNMTALFKAYGFTVKVLTKDATLANVRTALDQAKQAASSVFYYSGRGSWTESLQDNRTVPTLLLADSQAGSSDFDLRLTDLEQWSRNANDPWIVIDACWSPTSWTRTEGRPMNTTPRYYARSASKRGTYAFQGVGGFWTATDFQGCAYDWKTSSPSEFSGAFSSSFGWTLAKLALADANVTMGSVQESLNAYFGSNSDSNYLAGQRPFAGYYEKEKSLLSNPYTAMFRKPMFGGGFASSALPLSHKALSRSGTFRIALGFDGPGWSTRARNDCYRQFLRALKAAEVPVTIVPLSSSVPDCTLSVSNTGNGTVSVRLGGGPRAQAQHPEPFGPGKPTELLAGGLLDTLRCYVSLKRLLEVMLTVNGSQGVDINVKLNKPSGIYEAQRDRVTLSAEARSKGRLYVIDVASARLHLDVPFAGKKRSSVVNNLLEPGKNTVFFDAEDGFDAWVMAPGSGTMICLFIETETGPTTPIDGSDASIAKLADEIRQMLETPGSKWTVKKLPYMVRNSP